MFWRDRVQRVTGVVVQPEGSSLTYLPALENCLVVIQQVGRAQLPCSCWNEIGRVMGFALRFN